MSAASFSASVSERAGAPGCGVSPPPQLAKASASAAMPQILTIRIRASMKKGLHPIGIQPFDW
jgi:hypothetical protein